MEEKVVLAPGNVFSVSQTAALFLRFNVAQLADKRTFAVIKRAMESHGRP
jgi:DNA-binding transcriptional MocR family regulator